MAKIRQLFQVRCVQMCVEICCEHQTKAVALHKVERSPVGVRQQESPLAGREAASEAGLRYSLTYTVAVAD
jgi:hypothetical protein